VSVERFWPATEPAQLDYEHLRALALAGALLAGPQAERFQRGGLMALIQRPTAYFLSLRATVVAVPRPRWSPYIDPRLDALADAYALVAAACPDPVSEEVAQ
jgi:hypothetical protein